jgi:hypothetical protein
VKHHLITLAEHDASRFASSIDDQNVDRHLQHSVIGSWEPLDESLLEQLTIFAQIEAKDLNTRIYCDNACGEWRYHSLSPALPHCLD